MHGNPRLSGSYRTKFWQSEFHEAFHVDREVDEIDPQGLVPSIMRFEAFMQSSFRY